MTRVLHTLVVLILLFSVPVAVGQELELQRDSTYGEVKSVVFRECDGDDLRLYLFYPAASKIKKPRPTVVFFFGGGWVGGTPKQFKPHAEYFASRGMVAVLADYRTKRSHGTTPKECVADAQSAISYLRTHAEELGVTQNKIVAAGGSAGGHLAAATATVARLGELASTESSSSIPNALVLFNPVFNNGPGEWGHKTVAKYWRQISPAHNIGKTMPPTIIFLGSKDKLISVATARDFQTRLNAIGARCDLHVYEGQGHGFFNFGRGKNIPFVDTVEKMDRFLSDLGYLNGRCTIREFLKTK